MVSVQFGTTQVLHMSKRHIRPGICVSDYAGEGLSIMHSFAYQLGSIASA